MDYQKFIDNKRIIDTPTGLDSVSDLHPDLFPFQRDIVSWSLRRGRAAIFADCGMGKTLMQLEWANQVPGKVMVVAPLAVAHQTVREAAKFGIDGVRYHRAPSDSTRITVTNYEMLEHFDPDEFTGVVLDESSILKSYTGKFRNMIIERWGRTQYRLAATATPAPNDIMELGNHAEFLGAMTRAEMLAMFFVHDGGETQKWRVKGHAGTEFWKWVCSWAVLIRKPSDLGYDDGGFVLPPLTIDQTTVDAPPPTETGMLFAMNAHSLQERQQARKASVSSRVAAVADLVNGSDECWVVWCDRNDESDALCKAIPDAVEVKGSDSPELKSERLNGFSDGQFRVLVSKPKIAGWGMNWQHCSHMAFTGLSDSYEQFYQSVRRCWRFGQDKEVFCHVVTSSTEGAVVANIKRKEKSSESMVTEMVANMHDITLENIKGTVREDKSYIPTQPMMVPSFI